jgi:hypothetical protein
MTTEHRILPVKLTAEEIDGLGRKLGDHEHELRELERAKKSANANFKQDIDAKKEQILEVSTQVRTGLIDREIECIWEANYSRGIKELRRTDTMAVIETESLTDEERQLLFHKE